MVALNPKGRYVMVKSRFLCAMAFVSLVRMLYAQTQSNPSFEVASVKPNKSGDQASSSFVLPGSRYTATNVPLRTLVKSAYGLHDTQLVGGPNWINTERFDIRAKAEGYITASAFRDQARLMLRPLLADRFKLVLRRERRDLPVYALVKAGTGFGPQIRRTEPRQCNELAVAVPPAPGGAEPGIPLICGAEVYRAGHLAARSMALSNLVLNVSRWTDRVVVDRTGLEGKFDWDLQWVPDDLTPDSASPPPEGPLLFAALREQAGLKLERGRDSVEVLVVESVERPQPD
jgi:bla regulator protein blaR1